MVGVARERLHASGRQAVVRKPLERRRVDDPIVTRMVTCSVTGGLAPAVDAAPRGPVVQTLQRGAGNAAVTALVRNRPRTAQRQVAAPAAPAPAAPAADLKTSADIDAMTLNAFHAYAESQADWSTSPSLTGAARRQLMTLLEWARGHGPVLTGCGELLVADLKRPVGAAGNRRDLEVYSAGVEAQGDVINVPAFTSADANSVTRAIGWGDAMQQLYRAPGPAAAKRGVKQDAKDENIETGQLEMLVKRRWVGDLVTYHQRVRPFWESEADCKNYLRQRDEDATNPLSFVGSVPDVRNYHRFEADLLRAARDNRRDRSRRRPLSLVMHTSHDHNGAFMRDGNLTAAFQRPSHLTLLIEGAESLAAIEGRLPALARTYGKNRKISEAMVAGHGGSRSIELAGVPGAASQHSESLDLDRDARTGNNATERFFNSLLANMENSPDARIVLNACLTASNEVNRPLDPANPAQARTDIQAAIAANPSLTTRVRDLAAASGMGTTVRGASGSFSSEATLLDAAGRLDIASVQDPQLTNTDKMQYVRHGLDPEGVMRAVVECWAADGPRTLTLMEERRDELAGNAALKPTIIREFFSIVLSTPANRNNAQLMNQFANAGTPLEHLAWEDESEPEQWAGADTLHARVPSAHMAALLPPVVTAATPENRVARLVTHLAWAASQAARVNQFLATSGTHTCRDLDKFVPTSLLTGHLSMASLLGAAGNEAARARLAVVAVRKGWPGNADAKTYLQGLLGTNRTFPAATGVGGALAGYWSEPQLLAAIDRAPADLAPPPAGGGGVVPAGGPAPNIDLDRDGVNDFYVVPATEHGGVTARALNVRDGPDLTAAIVDSLGAGERVDIIGHSGDWLAIDHRRRPRFVHRSYIRIGAAP